MKYAVIQSGGKQYKVSEGDVIDVDKVLLKKDDKITFDKVLLAVIDTKIELGKPYLPGIKVTGKVLEQFKGEKIRVSKFKAKVRVRRVLGFRAHLSKIKIEKIESVKTTLKKASKSPKKVK
ncbi:MAG: 50S ribosomal protein L21 [Candidatus Levybacteria bacterium RBG_16_35_6]|nr:MAG: 50S ribosomal protein L21 [Candidatus Levybacteria bacterium RBG_16_35_6]